MTDSPEAEHVHPTPINLDYSLTEGQVSFLVHEELFSLDAVYGAAYLFVDRCWLFFTRPADKQVGVHLKSKSEADESALEALAGEFANELLNHIGSTNAVCISVHYSTKGSSDFFSIQTYAGHE